MPLPLYFSFFIFLQIMYNRNKMNELIYTNNKRIGYILFILYCFIVTSYEWHMMSKNRPYTFLGFIFIIFSFYTVYYLRNEFYGDFIYFLMIFLICIFTDIGGYIFGRTFKGPKLTKISPNKTYSGMFGGYFLSIVFMSLFFINLEFLFGYTNIEFTG